MITQRKVSDKYVFYEDGIYFALTKDQLVEMIVLHIRAGKIRNEDT
jgi:hypothetical protein